MKWSKIIFLAILFSFKVASSQNDDCASAVAIVSSTNSVCNVITGNSSGATQSTEPACTGTNDDDVWYKFVASSTSCSLSVSASSSYDAVVEVYSGSCGFLNSMKCMDNVGSGGVETAHLSGLIIGNTYYFRVFDYYTNPATTTFSICLFNTTPPVNDDCANAINVPVTSNCNSPIAGTSYQATESLSACSGNADDDVWYKFTASSSSNYITVDCSSGYDGILEVYSGSCGFLTSISCNDHSGAGGIEYAQLNNLIQGQLYYFRIHDYHQNSGTNTFSICIINSPPPVNDECAGAITVFSALTCTNTVSGTSEFGTQSGFNSCAGNNTDDVWYKFTAVGNTQTLTVVGSSGYDAVVEVFSGSCGTLTSIQCLDNAGTGGTESFVFGSLTAGSVYYFRVHRYSFSVNSTTTFTVCLQHGFVPPPPNDDCVNAQLLPVTTVCTQTVTNGTSENATTSTSGGCTGNADDDVWYKFVATHTDIKVIVQPSNNMDAVVQLFDGTCSNLNSLNCMDAEGVGSSEIEVLQATALTIGQTYYVRVYDYYSNLGYPFTISVVSNEVKLNVSNTSVCEGSSVNLSVSGATSYTWSTGANSGSISVTPSVSTTYSVAATSTGSCLYTDSVRIEVGLPVTPSICLVSVDSAGINNEIVWEKTLYANVDSFIVYRETSAGIYKRIGSVDNNAYSTYIDTNRMIGPANGNPNFASYKYKLQIRDTCGHYGTMSLWHQTIYMQDLQTGTFNWNTYNIESSVSPVSSYNLKQVDLATGTETLIANTTFTTYVDPQYATNWNTNSKWLVDGFGFNCYPSQRVMAQKVKTKSNHANDKLFPLPQQSVIEYFKNIVVKMHPNPANDNVIVELSTLAEHTQITITDVLGKQMLLVDATEKVNKINTSSLVSGIYFVNIVFNGKITGVKKLIIE